MIPSQSLLTVTSTMSLYEKALRGRRGPAGSKGTAAVPGQPTSSEACPPTLRPSTPLLLCPCRTQPGGSGKGFPESFLSCAIFSGDSQPASRQYRRRAAREGQCPVRGVGLSLAHYRESLWDSNFLPSFLWGQSRLRSDHSQTAGQTRPFAFSSFLLSDELLSWFPFGNSSFQQAVGSRGPGCVSDGLPGLSEVLLDLPGSSSPLSLNPLSQLCPSSPSLPTVTVLPSPLHPLSPR